MRLLISAVVVLGMSLTPSCATITTLCDMRATPGIPEYPMYVESKHEHCGRIKTLDDCTSAAKYLGYTGDPAISDVQESSKSADPPQCYIEGGILKFNDGTNFGPCSMRRKWSSRSEWI